MRLPDLPPVIYLLLLCLLPGCKKDDNEPMPQSTVSRLYISNADTDASVASTMIIDPADQSPFPDAYVFDSKLPDGNGIVFNPFSGTVFQVSRQNKNIRTLTVNTDGTLKERKSFIDEALSSAREIAYDHSRDLLYIASNSDSSLYVYEKASTLNGNITASKKLKLDGEPWGIHLDNNRLFVVIDHERAEVQLFESASEIAVGAVNPTKRIKIAGAERLHGITYSPSRSALILTDIGESSLPGYNTDGAVYIIEEADEKFTSEGQEVAPTRKISGAGTFLGNPADVAIDNRADKDYIYIAEKANKRILVFRYSDDGNASPAINAILQTSPEAIYLDAR